jgi:hypothetical protein
MLRSPSYRRDALTGIVLMLLIWLLLALGQGFLSPARGGPPPGTRSAGFPRAGSAIPLEKIEALIAEDLDQRAFDGER